MRKFYCYSTRLRDALIDHGFTPIGYGVNPNSDAPFWIFDGTEEMNAYKNGQYQQDRDYYFRERNSKEVAANGT